MNVKSAKFKKVWGIVSILCIALAIGLVLNNRNMRGVPVQWTTLSPQRVLKSILANGRVAGSKVTPLSLLKNGIVDKIYVKDGQKVTRDDTLVVLDNREEVSAVAQRRNALIIATLNIESAVEIDQTRAVEKNSQAGMTVEQALARYSRVETLFKEGSASKELLDQVKKELDIARSEQKLTGNTLDKAVATQIEVLKSQKAQAQAQLNDALIALSRTVMKAPDDGTIVKIIIERGQLVGPGSAVLQFLPFDTTTHVEVQVDESEIVNVRSGLDAFVIPTGSDETFRAVVQNVVPLIDATNGTATVNLALKTISPVLIPDLSVTAQIVTDTIQNALAIQQIFVQVDNDNAFVFVKKGDRANKTVVIVDDAGNGWYVVTDGASAGDTLVMAPSIKNDDRVTLSKSK